MKMRFLMLIATLIFSMALMADTQSDWYASLSKKREVTEVGVGGEYWHASDADKPLPYRFSCGAVLRATAGSLRLDLNNVSVTNHGIYADGNFAILLAGNNYISGGLRIVHVDSYYPLLIFGPGSLIVRGGYPGTISSSELAICAGASVTVYDTSGGWTPLSGRKLLVNASSLAVFAPDTNGTNFDSINILGAAVTICAKHYGLYAYGGTVVIEGSVVNLLSQNYESIYTKTLVCRHSYLSCVSCSHYGISTDESHFDNSLVKVYSRSGATINTDKVVFGEGDYYVVCGHPPMPLWSADYTDAIRADDMVVDGGNVQVCSVGTDKDSHAVNAYHFEIDSGRLEIVDKVNVREFLKYDAAVAAVYTGALASGIDITALMANFYSQVILDAISNGKIGDAEGTPNVGIGTGGSCTYTQNCGTVWCDLAKYGVMCYKPVVNGGSYKGQFYNPSYSRDGHDLVAPMDSNGNKLNRIERSVAGAKKYDKIMQSWSGILPASYGTGSLYADGEGKLYFWVPETWTGLNEGTGSSSNPGDGGNPGGGSAVGATDLAFYVPEHQGWTASLIVSSDPFATAPQKTFEYGEPICLNYAFKNVGNGLAVSNFVNRFTLSNGYYWEDSWVGYFVSENGWGWLGYNFAPAFLNGLPPGDYTLTCALNATGSLTESNMANNTASVSFTVKGPDLVVSSLSVARETITVSESVAVNWRVANTGSTGAGKTKTSFLTYDYNSSTKDLTLRKTEVSDCEPLAAGGSREYMKTITGKALGVGEHNIAVWVDSKSDVVESNETNNWKFVYVKVVNDAATSSKVGIDWQFYKIKGEADSFCLSASSDLKKKATSFNVGQPIYMRCCWWNAKKNSVYSKMRCSIYLNGAERLYADVDSIEKNYYKFFTDTRPSFLQNLPAGSYTLTAVLDSENAWQETDEKNNVKTISFTVVGKPTIYAESSYRCAVNVPVSWPVTIDGKATVKGLPSGLKYSGGAITGKATKTGTYTATFPARNAAGSASKTITIVVENPGFAVKCSAQPNGEEVRNVASGDTLELFVGVKQTVSLSATPGMAGIANSAASSMSAKGLPAGLKFANGVISGVPTKPGTYSASITIKNKYGWTSSFSLNFKISALPAWAQGSFEGGCGTSWDDGARVTLTVSSAGKMSGKVFRLGETWAMTAAAYSSCIDGCFVFDAVLKNGKNSVETRMGIWQFREDIGEFYMPVGTWEAEVYGTRLAWSSGICADALVRSKAVGTSVTLEGESYGLVQGESIVLTFAKNGVVKATATLAAGEKNGKTVFAKRTSSSNMVPWWVSDGDSGKTVVTGAKLFLHFPPSGKTTSDGRMFVLDAELADGAVRFLLQ